MSLSSPTAQVEPASTSAARSERRAAARSALRALLTTTVLVYVYFEAPMTRAPDATGAGLLLLGLVAFCGVLALQIRSVMKANLPRLRAFEVLVTAIPFLLLLFATSYFLMARHDAHAFSQSLTRMDALYFTVTVFATVGFGDITASSQIARIAVTVQMMGDLVVIGLGLRLLLSAVQVGLSRRKGEPGSEGPGQITPSG